MSKQTRQIIWDFRGALKPPAVASRQGIWVSKVTGSCTILSVAGGSIDLAMDATNEVQNASLDFGDILSLDLTTLVRIEFLAKVSASLAAAVSGAFGIRTARNDNLDSPTLHASFKFDGSNAIVCESDDNVTDLDDKASGISLAATYRRFAIDFSVGNLSQSPPSLSKGGLADLRYFISNDTGKLNQVVPATRFDLSGYGANINVQPYAQIQKTSGTAVGTLSILEVMAEYRLPA